MFRNQNLFIRFLQLAGILFLCWSLYTCNAGSSSDDSAKTNNDLVDNGPGLVGGTTTATTPEAEELLPPPVEGTNTDANNTIPVAKAGTDQTILVGKTVSLDGSASSDADGDKLTYTWSLLLKPQGSQATLSSTNTATTSFVTDVKGSYGVELVVADGKATSPGGQILIIAVTPELALDAVSSMVSGSIVDAKTGNMINNVTVTVQGTGRQYVLDSQGNALESFTTNGVVDVALSETAKPSSTDRVGLTLVASAPGFVSSSVPLKIDQEGVTSFSLSMVNQSDPPEGVTMAENSVTSDTTTGAVTQELSVVTTDASATQVTIPQGTIMKDKEGHPLTGTLTTQVGYHSHQSSTALESFPGGLSVTRSDATGSNPSEGEFVSAGFVSVEVKDANGQSAATMDKSIAITMKVPAGTYNAEENRDVQDDDLIPLWSYDTGLVVSSATPLESSLPMPQHNFL
ncbi:PKD domain-containing protein [Deltaproteobacteria bacterium TL4]